MRLSSLVKAFAVGLVSAFLALSLFGYVVAFAPASPALVMSGWYFPVLHLAAWLPSALVGSVFLSRVTPSHSFSLAFVASIAAAVFISSAAFIPTGSPDPQPYTISDIASAYWIFILLPFLLFPLITALLANIAVKRDAAKSRRAP